MKSKDIFIIGAGSFAREVYHWIMQTGRFNVVGFLDSTSDNEKKVFNLPVYNHPSFFKGICDLFTVGIASPLIKFELFIKCLECGFKPQTIIHPTALIIYDSIIKDGSVICPNVVITTNVKIGTGVVLNIGCTVGHDSIIEDFSTIAPSVNISGNCHIKEGSHIGTNACIREKISIDKYSVLGMGAVLIRNIEKPHCTIVGNPARIISDKSEE